VKQIFPSQSRPNVRFAEVQLAPATKQDADSLRIDHHKLMFHPDRVSDWLKGERVYPIYMEISPTGACNHRCIFCGLDFMGYQRRSLDADLLMTRLTEMGSLGLKSVMFAGEGEPFLHKRMVEIIRHTRNSAGIDVALTTNGVLMRPEVAEQILGCTAWIKISLDAGTRETYGAIHGTRPEDFDKVCANIEQAVAIRRRQGASCTLGAQLLLLPDNKHEVVSLAERCREMGLDYLVVKPYSQHPQSQHHGFEGVSYSECDGLAEQLDQVRGNGFNVIFRRNAMDKWDGKTRSYRCCLALPFWSYLDAGGNIWGCSVYLGDERFLYGNIAESTFAQIWQGRRRMDSLRWTTEQLDVSSCRVGCRMDEVNRYLWELKHPHPHVNFI
jgi:MoaA/NifB/PqqE/SkfB family radical SAM enzyme